MNLRYCFLLLLIVSFAAHSPSFGQTWQPVGPDAANQALTTQHTCKLASDRQGGFYLAYIIMSDASVKHWDGEQWQYVGPPRFTGNNISVRHLDMSVSPDGTPYITYYDYNDSNRVAVQYYDSTWQSLGSASLPMETDLPVIAIGSSGTPFLAFIDNKDTGRITVKKWNGNNWQTVGQSGFSVKDVRGLKIALNNNEEPYILAEYFNSSVTGSVPRVCAYHFNGTDWQFLGDIGMTGNVTYLDRHSDITVGDNDTVYVAFTDKAHQYKMTVKKYNGNNWTTVGQPGITMEISDNPRLQYDSQNGLYLFCMSDSFNVSYPEHPTVHLFNGSTWELVGPNPFVFNNGGSFPAFAVDSAHQPGVVYFEGTDYFKSLFLIFDGNQWHFPDDCRGIFEAPGLLGNSAAMPNGEEVYMLNYFNRYGNSGDRLSQIYQLNDSVWTSFSESLFNSWLGHQIIMAISPTGRIWMVSQVPDSASPWYRTIAWRHDDTGWVNMSQYELDAQVWSIDFDHQGNAYFQTGGHINDPLMVKKYSDTNGWTTLNGSPLAPNYITHFSKIKVDRRDTLYCLYGAEIKKYDGNNWSNYGIGDMDIHIQDNTYADFDFDSTNRLTVAYVSRYQNEINVQVYNPVTGNFDDVIPGGHTGLFGRYPHIEFSPDGSLFVYYIDVSDIKNQSITVVRLVGNTFQPVGNVRLTATFPPLNGFNLLFLNNRLLLTYSEGTHYAYQFQCAVPVTITQQPETFVVCEGGNATFTTAADHALAYHWQMNNGQGWKSVPDAAGFQGINSPMLVIANVTSPLDSSYFRCVFSDSCGVISYSQPALLYIAPSDPPQVSISVSPGSLVPVGTPVTFAAQITNGGLNPQIQWLINDQPLQGATGTYLTISTLSDSDVVSAIVTRTDSCSLANTAESQPITMHITTGISETKLPYGVRIYPQPAKDYVLLTSGSAMPSGNYRLQVYDLSGRLVINRTIAAISGKTLHYRLEIPALLPDGIYLLRLGGGTVNIVSKLSILR